MTRNESALPPDIVLEERADLRVRIERYRKRYPDRDWMAYAEKLRKAARLEQVKRHLAEHLSMCASNAHPSDLHYAVTTLQQSRCAEAYLKGDSYAFDKIAEFLASSERMVLYQCDFRKAPIAENTIDWIITDPPYPQSYLPLYRDLALFAQRVLRPGGGLLAMVGQSYLPEIFRLMSVEGLQYNWTLCYLTPGGQSPQLWQRKVNTFWKPVLWFTKGKNTRWIGDVVKSRVNDNDKTYHFWGQSVSGMSDLVQKISLMGETVLDPFMGGGTTGAACLLHRRRFVGIELDAETFNTAQRRLRQMAQDIENQ